MFFLFVFEREHRSHRSGLLRSTLVMWILEDWQDGVFIFEAVSSEDSKTIQGYDAIVVEQWTVLEVSVGLAAALLLFGH